MSATHPTGGGSDVRRQRVLVVDDHRLLGQLLSTALSAESDLECVGTAVDTASAFTLAADLLPDVVVMDVRLGDGDGIAAAATLNQRFPDLRVVVLTAFADSRLAQRAAEAGACALVAKDGELGNLLRAIRTCVRGAFVVQDELLGPRPREEARRPERALDADQTALLRLLAVGLDRASIADELGTDVATARAAVDDLLTALGVDSELEAVSLGIGQGLLRVGPSPV